MLGCKWSFCQVGVTFFAFVESWFRASDIGVVPESLAEGDEVPVEVDEQEEGLMDILYDSELAVCGLGPGVDVAEVAGQEQFFGAMDLLADDDDIDLM